MPDAILGGIISRIRAAVTDSIDLVLLVAGAGASGAIVEVVRSWLPEQTAGMADETLAAAVGFVLFYWGDRIHKRLVPFGLGVFLSGVGAWSSGYVEGIISMLTKK